MPETRSMAISPDGRSLYVTYDATITTFSRDPNSGALQQLPGAQGCLVREVLAGSDCVIARGISGADDVAVAPDGRSLYVSSEGLRTSGIAVFARDPDSGVLTQLPGELGCISDGLAACARARRAHPVTDVAVAPNGATVYVTSARYPWLGSGGGDDRRLRARRPRRLAGPVPRPAWLREPQDTRMPSRTPRFIPLDAAALSPDGRSLYGISWASDGPVRHAIAADGSVRPADPAAHLPVANETTDQIAVDASGSIYDWPVTASASTSLHPRATTALCGCGPAGRTLARADAVASPWDLRVLSLNRDRAGARRRRIHRRERRHHHRARCQPLAHVLGTRCATPRRTGGILRIVITKSSPMAVRQALRSDDFVRARPISPKLTPSETQPRPDPERLRPSRAPGP